MGALSQWWAEANKTELLIETFGIYLALIVVFGCLYFRLFRRQPNRFLFASETLKWQRRLIRRRVANVIKRRHEQIRALKEVKRLAASES